MTVSISSQQIWFLGKWITNSMQVSCNCPSHLLSMISLYFFQFLANFALSIALYIIDNVGFLFWSTIFKTLIRESIIFWTSCLLSKSVSRNKTRNFISHTSTPFLVVFTSFGSCTHSFQILFTANKAFNRNKLGGKPCYTWSQQISISDK